jgi:hypothetical protein
MLIDNSRIKLRGTNTLGTIVTIYLWTKNESDVFKTRF